MPKMKILRRAEEKAPSAPTIENRRARYEYEIMETYVAGMALTGTEVKSLRTGAGASINEAYVRMVKGDVRYRFVLDIKTL